MTRAFISYSHADEALRKEFGKHLSLMRRQGLVDDWTDHKIPPGGEFEEQIRSALEAADLIVLLVSPDFIHSDYCYSVELARAMERHRERSAIVVPVILRPVDWQSAPFGALKVLPRDGRPVVSWPTADDGFVDAVRSLRELLLQRSAAIAGAAPAPAPVPVPARAPAPAPALNVQPDAATPPVPRASPTHLAREFTDLDRDTFLDDSFGQIRAYFEVSLKEMGAHNPGAEGRLRPVSEVGFTATVYRHGKKLAGCYVRVSKSFGRDRSIGFSNDDSARDNSYNEMLSVDSDRHDLHLSPMMRVWSDAPSKLTPQQAAEHLWRQFVAHLT